MTIASRMALRPSVKIGIRQDGGDAETRRGMDLGAGLVLADGVTGLAVDIRVRRLLVHQAVGFAESGMSISVSYNPRLPTPLGFTARVSPAWGGDGMSGAEALWGRENIAGMGNDPLMNGGGRRLDTEAGYGMPIGSRFVGTPRASVRTSEYGRDYRIGYGMQVLEQGRLNLQLGIDAERRESPLLQRQEQSRGTDQRVLGRATVQSGNGTGRTRSRPLTQPRPGAGRPPAGTRSNKDRNALRSRTPTGGHRERNQSRALSTVWWSTARRRPGGGPRPKAIETRQCRETQYGSAEADDDGLSFEQVELLCQLR